MNAAGQSSTSPVSIVQFQTRTFYAVETEGEMCVDVVRLGDADGTVTVAYECEDGAAKGGINYTAVSGTLTFASGETEQSITVPILDTGNWNPTLEFHMRLSTPTGATVGLNLHQCRVWIIDKDRFPSSKAGEHSHSFTLLYEFFLHAARHPVVRSGSLKTFAIDQLPNVLYVVQLAIQVRLVDHILQPLAEEREQQQEQQAAEPPTFLAWSVHPRLASTQLTALVMGLSYALPIWLINYFRLSKCWLGVGGAARKQLQANLLRKYVNLTTRARAEVGRAGVIEALSRYSYEVVDHGYMRIFDCAKSLGKILILLAWSITVSAATFPLMLLLPTSLILRVVCMERESTALRLKLFRMQVRGGDRSRTLPSLISVSHLPLSSPSLPSLTERARCYRRLGPRRRARGGHDAQLRAHPRLSDPAAAGTAP